MFMFSYNKGKFPKIFEKIFQENRKIHQYATRSANNLRPPRIKSQLADRFIKRSGVEFWNKISKIIPINVSLGTFKKHLKNYLLDSYKE